MSQSPLAALNAFGLFARGTVEQRPNHDALIGASLEPVVLDRWLASDGTVTIDLFCEGQDGVAFQLGRASPTAPSKTAPSIF